MGGEPQVRTLIEGAQAGGVPGSCCKNLTLTSIASANNAKPRAAHDSAFAALIVQNECVLTLHAWSSEWQMGGCEKRQSTEQERTSGRACMNYSWHAPSALGAGGAWAAAAAAASMLSQNLN